ncbi:MAG: hypothetical protein JNL62_11555, partial [Bryobacterales bacterium]|nr:hypothetical protein [Bryobacterales bacterium]
MQSFVRIASILLCALFLAAQDSTFTGLTTSLETIYRTAKAKTFSISPENFTGEKGKAAMAVKGSASEASSELGQGWKVNPYVVIQPGTTFTLADIQSQGAIQHIW